jgi:hypothetical protein
VLLCPHQTKDEPVRYVEKLEGKAIPKHLKLRGNKAEKCLPSPQLLK